MRKLIMWNVVTLDGCFEGEKPWDLSFHELVWGSELEELSNEQLDEADMLIFGKNTYIGMKEYWTGPDAEGESVADKMNLIHKIVCSCTLKRTDWNNTEIVREAIKDLPRIKQEGDRPIYLFGSANLARSLMNANLLDEIRLCIAPVVLGKGNRLFTSENIMQSLKTIESKQLKNGGVFVKYKVINK